MSDVKRFTDKAKHRLYTLLSLKYFFNTDFAEAFEHVEGFEMRSGAHLNDVCDRMQKSSRTATIGARKHSKSTVLYAKAAWHVRRLEREPCEAFLISSNEDMAAYHTSIIRKYVEALADMEALGDVRFVNNAKTIVELRHNVSGFQAAVTPKGLFASYRGAHPHIVYCEDILGEPGIRVDSVNLKLAEKQFTSVITKLPKKQGGQLHLMGNVLTADDLHFQLKDMVHPGTKAKIYDWAIYPAIVRADGRDDVPLDPPMFEGGVPLWPEEWSMDDLLTEYGEGSDDFMTQYMCRPAVLADSYIAPELLFNPEQGINLLDSEGERQGLAYAGYDPGQKRHPAHAALFVLVDNELWQQQSNWFNVGTPYMDQLATLLYWDKQYTLGRLCWDASRADLLLEKERRALPPSFLDIGLNNNVLRFKAALALKKLVQQRRIHLLPRTEDLRQYDQLLAVNRELRAAETRAGHGESFWSIALAALAYSMDEGEIVEPSQMPEPDGMDRDAEALWRELINAKELFEAGL